MSDGGLHPAERYIRGVLDGTVVVGKRIRLAVERHVRDLERAEAGDPDFPFYFDPAAADRPIQFVHNFCRHSKGEWAGQPVVLEDWQQFSFWVAFGWRRRETGYRRFRIVYKKVARKNGKSTETSGVGIYLTIGDREPGAEVYSAATKKDQAKIIHDEAVRMVRKSPDLSEVLTVVKNNISHIDSASKFEPLSADEKTLDGLNVHGGLLDEIHAHPNRGVFDVIETATGARRQALIWIITTAGIVTPNSIALELEEYGDKILRGIIKDETFLPLCWDIDAEPSTVVLHSLPALRRVEGLCTCNSVTPILIKNLWEEVCAKHATTSGGQRTGKQSELAAILKDLYRREVCAEPVTKNGSSNTILSTDCENKPKSLNGPGVTGINEALRTPVGETNTASRIASHWSDGHSNTGSLPKSSIDESRSKAGDAESAVSSQSIYAWITATSRVLFGDYFVGTATPPSPLSEIVSRVYNAHSPTCKAREASLADGKITVHQPADDPWDERVWVKANPNLGVSVKLDDLRAKAVKARETPAAQNNFFCKHLNVWSNSRSRWVAVEQWDACREDFPLEELLGRECYGGLDLSTTTDISALKLVFPWDGGVYRSIAFYWVPEENADLRARRDRVPYPQWIRDGYIEATPGNVIDYAFIEHRIVQVAKLYKLKELAADPWNATQTLQRLQEQHGIKVAEMRQGFVSMSAPMKHLQALVLSRKYRHRGDPVSRWMFDNVSVKQDPAGNIKPDKEKSAERIDGVVADIMAVDRAALRKVATNPYEKRGILAV